MLLDTLGVEGWKSLSRPPHLLFRFSQFGSEDRQLHPHVEKGYRPIPPSAVLPEAIQFASTMHFPSNNVVHQLVTV